MFVSLAFSSWSFKTSQAPCARVTNAHLCERNKEKELASFVGALIPSLLDYRASSWDQTKEQKGKDRQARWWKLFRSSTRNWMQFRLGVFTSGPFDGVEKLDAGAETRRVASRRAAPANLHSSWRPSCVIEFRRGAKFPGFGWIYI